jgi:hypothetical protein
MAILEGEIKKIQIEEISGKSICSERFWQKVGTTINELAKRTVFGLGDIMPSPLDESEFQAQHGAEWVACDGQNIEGSLYSAQTGNAFAPDYRGKFHRQVNTDSTGLDANRSLGTLQSSDNKNHFHLNIRTNTTPLVTNALSKGYRKVPEGWGDWQIVGSNAQPNHAKTGPVNLGNVASENRPDNITFNFFIKIN